MRDLQPEALISLIGRRLGTEKSSFVAIKILQYLLIRKFQIASITFVENTYF